MKSIDQAAFKDKKKEDNKTERLQAIEKRLPAVDQNKATTQTKFAMNRSLPGKSMNKSYSTANFKMIQQR